MDVVFYSIRKFVKLAMANNPNIIECLYAPEENILEISPAGEALMEMKFRLLNKRYIRDHFLGYSISEQRKFNNDNSKLKNISRCTRILYEGVELLQHGALTFPRPESSLLLDIRNGLVSHEDIINNIKFLREEINYEYNMCNFLPDITNNDIIEYEMVEIIKKYTRR
jgi:predicted nucleotidyltransferase